MRNECVTWMIVAIVTPIFQGITFRRCRPVYGSCVCYAGGSSWVCEIYVQEGRTMGRRKPGLDVSSRASSAGGGRAYLVVARRHAVAVPGACSHTVKCIFLVVVPAAAAATKLRAGHGMILSLIHISEPTRPY